MLKKAVVGIFLTIFVLLANQSGYAQVCATPGLDGSALVGGQVNTYYPPAANTTLSAGAKVVTLK